jgi:uncharacterized protein (TIGR00369 family)
MTIAEIEAFLVDHFPAAAGFGKIVEVVGGPGGALTMRLPYRAEYLRPGGTISGPTLMTLADTAAYYLILATMGPLALAVTSNLNIHFLSKPRPGDVVATARMLKAGRRLVVAEVEMRSDGADELVAQATITYALPQA